MTQDDAAAAAKPLPKKNQRRARRKAPKRSTRALAYANALGLGANIAVQVLDVSESGVRLLLKRNLPKGKEFEVNLESVGSRPVRLLAVVAWSVAAADGYFVVGAAFEKALSYADLQMLARV